MLVYVPFEFISDCVSTTFASRETRLFHVTNLLPIRSLRRNILGLGVLSTSDPCPPKSPLSRIMFDGSHSLGSTLLRVTPQAYGKPDI